MKKDSGKLKVFHGPHSVCRWSALYYHDTVRTSTACVKNVHFVANFSIDYNSETRMNESESMKTLKSSLYCSQLASSDTTCLIGQLLSLVQRCNTYTNTQKVIWFSCGEVHQFKMWLFLQWKHLFFTLWRLTNSPKEPNCMNDLMLSRGYELVAAACRRVSLRFYVSCLACGS